MTRLLTRMVDSTDPWYRQVQHVLRETVFTNHEGYLECFLEHRRLYETNKQCLRKASFENLWLGLPVEEQHLDKLLTEFNLPRRYVYSK